MIATVALAGCGTPTPTYERTASPITKVTASNYDDVLCPSDVVRNAGGAAACGYLSVPEDRQRPDDGSVRLFVVRQRPTGDLAPDPVLSIEELGWAHHWSEPDGLPGRVHREVVTVDARGTGRSEPSLACAEIEDAAPSLYLGAPAGDAFPASSLDPVRACHERLVGAGIDPANYGLAAIAADTEDLRIALGVNQWNLRSKGGGSRIAWEIMRRYPASVRAAWFDSPELPSTDLLSAGIVGTRQAMAALDAACAADPACHQAYPEPEALLAQSLQRDDLIAYGTFDGKRIPLTSDPTSTMLAVRFALAAAPGMVLPALASVAGGSYLEDSQDYFTEQPPFTIGYVMDQWDMASSSRTSVFSHGALFSSVCRDQMPFVDAAALGSLAGGEDRYVQAFVRSPFPDICTLWDAGSAGPEVHELVSSGIPTLLLAGQYDTFGVPSLVEQAASKLPASRFVTFTGLGHNVLALDCALSIRDAWLDQPTVAPDAGCADDLPFLPAP